jgi:hypothetical protein
MYTAANRVSRLVTIKISLQDADSDETSYTSKTLVQASLPTCCATDPNQLAHGPFSINTCSLLLIFNSPYTQALFIHNRQSPDFQLKHEVCRLLHR